MAIMSHFRLNFGSVLGHYLAFVAQFLDIFWVISESWGPRKTLTTFEFPSSKSKGNAGSKKLAFHNLLVLSCLLATYIAFQVYNVHFWTQNMCGGVLLACYGIDTFDLVFDLHTVDWQELDSSRQMCLLKVRIQVWWWMARPWNKALGH